MLKEHNLNYAANSSFTAIRLLFAMNSYMRYKRDQQNKNSITNQQKIHSLKFNEFKTDTNS